MDETLPGSSPAEPPGGTLRDRESAAPIPASRRSTAFVAACTSAMLLGAAALVVTAFAARPATARQAPLIDRVAAVVNGEIISRTQLQRAERTARDAEADPTAGCTPPANDAAAFEARVLECMIDDLLQFQHVRRFPQFDVRQQDIDDAFQRAVEQYGSRAAFEQALREQQRTAEEVRYDLEREALIANYVAVRYREVVEVTEREIVRYYEDVLRPEMERQGAELPPLETVRADISAVLLETEVNRRVDEWIADLRRRADVVVYAW